MSARGRGGFARGARGGGGAQQPVRRTRSQTQREAEAASTPQTLPTTSGTAHQPSNRRNRGSSAPDDRDQRANQGPDVAEPISAHGGGPSTVAQLGPTSSSSTTETRPTAAAVASWFTAVGRPSSAPGGRPARVADDRDPEGTIWQTDSSGAQYIDLDEYTERVRSEALQDQARLAAELRQAHSTDISRLEDRVGLLTEQLSRATASQTHQVSFSQDQSELISSLQARENQLSDIIQAQEGHISVLQDRIQAQSEHIVEQHDQSLASPEIARTAVYPEREDLEDMYAPDSEPETDGLPRRPGEDRSAYRARRDAFQRQRTASQPPASASARLPTVTELSETRTVPTDHSSDEMALAEARVFDYELDENFQLRELKGPPRVERLGKANLPTASTSRRGLTPAPETSTPARGSPGDSGFRTAPGTQNTRQPGTTPRTAAGGGAPSPDGGDDDDPDDPGDNEPIPEFGDSMPMGGGPPRWNNVPANDSFAPAPDYVPPNARAPAYDPRPYTAFLAESNSRGPYGPAAGNQSSASRGGVYVYPSGAAAPSAFVAARQAPEYVEPAVLQSMRDLERMIEEELRDPLPTGANPPKNIQMKAPEPYNGEDDVRKLEEFVFNVVHIMTVSNMCGPHFEKTRLVYFGTLLRGEAQRWYRSQVMVPMLRSRARWTLPRAVSAMYLRFINRSDAQYAADEFDRSTYNSTGGVHRLYHDLCFAADRMVVVPNNYEIARRFVRRLPATIRSDLLRIHNVTAENTPLDRIFQVAQTIESNLLRLGISIPTHATSSSSSRAQASSTGRGNAATGARAPASSTTSSTSPRPNGPPAQTSGRVGTRNFSAAPRSYPAPAARASGAPAVPASSVNKGKQVDMSTIRCFKCNRFGHYSTDPKCPANRGAMRMVDDAADPADATDPAVNPDSADMADASVQVEQLHHISQEEPAAAESFPEEADDYVQVGEILSMYDGSQYDPGEDEAETFGYVGVDPDTEDEGAAAGLARREDKNEPPTGDEFFQPYFLDDYYLDEEQLLRAAALPSIELAAVVGSTLRFYQSATPEKNVSLRDVIKAVHSVLSAERPPSADDDVDVPPPLEELDAAPLPDNVGAESAAETAFVQLAGLADLFTSATEAQSTADFLSRLICPTVTLAPGTNCAELFSISDMEDADDIHSSDGEVSEPDRVPGSPPGMLVRDALGRIVVTNYNLATLFHSLPRSEFFDVVGDHIAELDRRLNVETINALTARTDLQRTRDELYGARLRLHRYTREGIPTAFDGAVEELGRRRRPQTRQASRLEALQSTADRLEGENDHLRDHVMFLQDEIEGLRREFEVLQRGIALRAPHDILEAVISNGGSRFAHRAQHTRNMLAEPRRRRYTEHDLMTQDLGLEADRILLEQTQPNDPVAGPSGTTHDDDEEPADPEHLGVLMAIEETIRARRAAIRPQGTARERPLARGFSMALRGRLNGLDANILLDTGSTINAVSPEFTRVAGLTAFELSNPISLQLGCVGSRSKANFGVETTITIAGSNHTLYMDVVNVPKYDIVLGLPFMHQTQMILDFCRYTVTIGNSTLRIARGEDNGQRNAWNRTSRPATTPKATVLSVRLVGESD